MNFRNIFFFLLLTGAFSCTKNFDEINHDPNHPTEVEPDFLLTSSILNTMDLYDGSMNRVVFFNYAQHFSGFQGEFQRYTYSDGNNNTYWANTYIECLQPLHQIEIAYRDNPAYKNRVYIARIWKDYILSNTVSIWGGIPTDAALNGDPAIPYTKEEDLYYTLLDDLKSLADSIDLDGDRYSEVADKIYKGNLLKWKKFANTMRMDMALRLSEKDPTKGQAEFVAALNASGGPIEDNSENIEWAYIDDPNYLNPWYTNYSISNRNDFALSKTLTDYMLPKGDKRITLYAEELAGADPYKGLPYGSSTAKNIPNAYSRIGDYFRSKTGPARIFNYPQVLFMVAEATKRGWLPGGDAAAAVAYEEAIKASWEMNGVYNLADFTAYYANVVYNPATAIQQIITEKWVHNYLNGYAAWNDWRRTGFPILTPAADAVDARGIPVRQGYPVAEQTQNKDSYTAAVANQGADDNYTKLWWDN